jgi:hypothetical protein
MAYTLFGHGSEPIQKDFIVPEGCYIIAKALPDQQVTHFYLKKLMRHFAKPNTIFTDPVHSKKDLIEKFGSFSLYSPGERCPNFVYSLGPDYMFINLAIAFIEVVYTKSNKNRSEVDLWIDTTLGVQDIPFDLTKESIKTKFKNIHPYKLKIKQLNDYFYINSKYPTRDQVHNIFESAWGAEQYSQLEYYDFLKGSNKEENVLKLKECNKQLEITQEQLCEKFPGVYYNFICRSLRIKKTSLPYWIQSGIDWTINPNIVSYSTIPQNTRRVVKKVIGEAELKRKYTVKNKYQGGQRNAKTRKRKNYKKE